MRKNRRGGGDVYKRQLLGRSADRSGLTLRVDEIPSPETAKDSISHGSVLPTLNTKLISNSLNILFDKLKDVYKRQRQSRA